MKTITNIEDLRLVAKRKIPRAIFEYYDCGSYDEITMRANRQDLDDIRLRQRIMLDVSNRNVATSFLGQSFSMPLVLGPTGSAGLARGDGEILAARAAQEAGIPFCLSTMSICSLEDLQASLVNPFWFQLYVMRDREFTRSLIQRAQAAGCTVLVLTADVQIPAQRHRDLKNGLSIPPRLTLANCIDMLCKPAWLRSVMLGKRKSFGNLEGRVPEVHGLNSLTHWLANQFDDSVTWADVEWIRGIWPGKLILKGVLDVEDAELAVKAGVDAMVVSNHGGRQLDGASSSITVLSEVVDKVAGRAEILFDGGVRSGQDILKARALGASACLSGRAFLYGLGAYGQQGVTMAIDLLRRELDVSMGLCGVGDIEDVSKAILHGRY